METALVLWLPYLSTFEEVQGNLNILQFVEAHAALLSGLEDKKQYKKRLEEERDQWVRVTVNSLSQLMLHPVIMFKLGRLFHTPPEMFKKKFQKKKKEHLKTFKNSYFKEENITWPLQMGTLL